MLELRAPSREKVGLAGSVPVATAAIQNRAACSEVLHVGFAIPNTRNIAPPNADAEPATPEQIALIPTRQADAERAGHPQSNTAQQADRRDGRHKFPVHLLIVFDPRPEVAECGSSGVWESEFWCRQINSPTAQHLAPQARFPV